MSGVALVIEDDEAIGALVGAYLEQAGFDVVRECTGVGGLDSAERQQPRVVVLDLGLPDFDGLELCRRLRGSADVPILILTARDEEADRIIGLELGADDYVTKPFSPRELVARVRAVLRRVDPAPPDPQLIELGDLSIDLRSRTVTVDGAAVELRTLEFELLAELARHAGQVVTRDRLLDRVWGLSFAGEHAPSTFTSRNCARSSAVASRSRPCAVWATAFSKAEVISLQTRLGLAIGASVLAAVALSLLVGAYLVGRSLEHSAFSGLQRQVALLAHEDLHPASGRFGRFLATQDERLSVIPKEQARLLLPSSATGRLAINGRTYLYATQDSGTDVLVLLRTASSVRAESKPFWVAFARGGRPRMLARSRSRGAACSKHRPASAACCPREPEARDRG